MSRSSRTVWCAAIRSARPLDGKFLPSVGALLAGKLRHQGKSRCGSISASRRNRCRSVSYVDVLRGDPAALQKLKGKKVIIGATAIELGDRFNVPNGRGHFGPRVLQMLAAEFDPARPRAARSSLAVVTLGGLGIHRASHAGAVVVALPPGSRVVVLVGLAAASNWRRFACRPSFAVDPRYVALACRHRRLSRRHGARRDRLSRACLRRVAEKRFQRIAMSLGDGLVCADQNGLHHGLEPGGRGDFRLPARGNDRPAARPDLRLATIGAGNSAPFSILELPLGSASGARRQGHGARGTPQERRHVSARSLFLRMARRRRFPVWRGDARHIRPQARSRKNTVPGGARHADRPRQPQHAA